MTWGVDEVWMETKKRKDWKSPFHPFPRQPNKLNRQANIDPFSYPSFLPGKHALSIWSLGGKLDLRLQTKGLLPP